MRSSNVARAGRAAHNWIAIVDRPPLPRLRIDSVLRSMRLGLIWPCAAFEDVVCDIDICAILLLDDLCLDADLGTIRLKLWKCFVSDVGKVSFGIVNGRW